MQCLWNNPVRIAQEYYYQQEELTGAVLQKSVGSGDLLSQLHWLANVIQLALYPSRKMRDSLLL